MKMARILGLLGAVIVSLAIPAAATAQTVDCDWCREIGTGGSPYHEFSAGANQGWFDCDIDYDSGCHGGQNQGTCFQMHNGCPFIASLIDEAIETENVPFLAAVVMEGADASLSLGTRSASLLVASCGGGPERRVGIPPRLARDVLVATLAASAVPPNN